MERLWRAREKRERLVVGLNSGTSMDGIDAILVRITGAGESVVLDPVRFEKTAYPPDLRRRLLPAPDFGCEEVCRLNREIAERFADAALALLRGAGLEASAVDLVGSHGQTVCHLPGRPDATSTLQIGDLDVLSARLGAPVVGDFRAADVAQGGAGAPLMPALDRVLFRDRPGTVTLNLGGITSLTWLGPRGKSPVAFDVGPANVALDLLAAHLTGGAQSADLGGRLASQGRVDEALVAGLLDHPFIAAEPPKTSGREEFGASYVRALLGRVSGMPVIDVLASHTALVGRSVARAVDRWIPGGRSAVSQVVASGGGIHNPALMDGIRSSLGAIPVRTLAEAGVDPDAKEALLFALLANDRLFDLPTNLPAVTGARNAVSLGKMASV